MTMMAALMSNKLRKCEHCGQEIIKPSDYKNDVAKALMYLNKLAGTRFKPVEANAKFLIARFKEGHTLQDVERVIDNKAAEWKGTGQEKYLRPATLFNATKFNQYVGQPEIKAKSPDSRYSPLFVDEEEAEEINVSDESTAFSEIGNLRKVLKG